MHQYHGSSWLGHTSKSFINHHQTDHRQTDQTTTSTRKNLPKWRKRKFEPAILPCGQYYNQEVAPVNNSAQPSINAYCRRSRQFGNRWLSQWDSRALRSIQGSKSANCRHNTRLATSEQLIREISSAAVDATLRQTTLASAVLQAVASIAQSFHSIRSRQALLSNLSYIRPTSAHSANPHVQHPSN